MSYTPTEWKSGDVVTSAKLNKIEQGVADAGGGGVVVVSGEWDAEETTFTLDKTYNELKALLLSGAVVVWQLGIDNGAVVYNLASCNLYNGTYYALFISAGFGSGGTPETIVLPCTTNSADGYPAFIDE